MTLVWQLIKLPPAHLPVSHVNCVSVVRCPPCRYFLHAASSFNQDLCDWGNTIGSVPYRTYVFTSTSCPNTGNPNLSASPKGPFCYVCPPPPTQSPSAAPTGIPSEAPTPVPTVSPTSDYFETRAELTTAISSGTYTAGDSPYGAIENWDVSRCVDCLPLVVFCFVGRIVL